jgi:membrane-bound lytic murein transglycosylase D
MDSQQAQQEGVGMEASRTSRFFFLGVALLALSVLAAWSTGLERPRGAEPTPMDELIAEAEASGEEAVIEWDLTMTRNEHVETWINFLKGRNADRTRLWLERSGRYGPMIQEELRRRGMPQDLLYLALIESGFSPYAHSVASAVGIWQFIAETGRRYGLEINAEVDERRDALKATNAALDYLEELYARFDSWYLAAAAYNTGENRVGRIMREMFGTERGADDHFWKIAHRLPRETRNYVPLMLAAAHIAKEPHNYGFDGLEYHPSLEFDEVWIPASVSLASIASAVDVSEDSLYYMNPHLLRKRTPPGRAWLVRLPEGSREQFAVNFPAIYQRERLAQLESNRREPAVTLVTAGTHTVRRGETLSHIAVRYGVSVSALHSANGNIAPTRLRAGQTIRVPGRSGSGPTASAGASRSSASSPRYHQVRRGENLTVLARRYGVSVRQLQSWNSMGGSTRILAGQRIRVG